MCLQEDRDIARIENWENIIGAVQWEWQCSVVRNQMQVLSNNLKAPTNESEEESWVRPTATDFIHWFEESCPFQTLMRWQPVLWKKDLQENHSGKWS